MPDVGIILGSDSDLPKVKKCFVLLEEFGVDFEVIISSAHRTPGKTKEWTSSAKDRGIKVIESTTNETEDFISLIKLRVKTNKGECSIAGTIFGKSDPWIVQVDQFKIEATPDKYMLLFHTQDRPGVIGNIGASLAKHGINISRMQFGREKIEGKSLLLLSTDDPVSAEVIKEMKGLPHVMSMNSIEITC